MRAIGVRELGSEYAYSDPNCPPAHAQGVFQPSGVYGGTYPAPAASGNQQYPQQAPTPPVITNVPARGGEREIGRPGQPSAQPPVYIPVQPGFQPQPQALPQPEERNEFQDFLIASTGRVLPIFGRSLFEEVPSTFAPVENIPVTPDYVIGPGDELYVRAWGQIDIDYRTTVDRNGTISIPRVGVINVAGIRYQDLGAYMKNAVSRVFRGFELTVTMGQLRSIQIFVVA